MDRISDSNTDTDNDSDSDSDSDSDGSLRECAAEQRTSSWLRARVAKGLRAAPLRQFRRANSRKAAQGGAKDPSSRIKPTHYMCRIFVCWLPKAGLLLQIFWAPRTEKGPYRYERFCTFLAPGMWLTERIHCVSAILGGKRRPQCRQSLGG